ncbi:response regulator, partial [Litorivivens sp.]
MSRRPVDQVLLVDDNPTNLQVLYKTLEGASYTLLAARDGEQALSIAKLALPSLILLDIMMPGIDGFEVCRRLKADAQTRGIPVIFLSALTDTEAIVKGFALGAVDYISKPFQGDEVRARVRTQLRIHRLEMELSRRNVELEDENQQILGAVAEGIFSLHRDLRIRSLNPQAEKLVERSLKDCVGETLFSLLSLEQQEDEVIEAISSGRVWRAE